MSGGKAKRKKRRSICHTASDDVLQQLQVLCHTQADNAPLFDDGKAGSHRRPDGPSTAGSPSSHSSYDDATSVARR